MPTNAPGQSIDSRSDSKEKSVEVYSGFAMTDRDIPIVLRVGIDDNRNPFVELQIGHDSGRLAPQAFDPYERIRVYRDNQAFQTKFKLYGRTGGSSGTWSSLPDFEMNEGLPLSKREFIANTISQNQKTIEDALGGPECGIGINDLDHIQQFINFTFGTRLRFIVRGL